MSHKFPDSHEVVINGDRFRSLNEACHMHGIRRSTVEYRIKTLGWPPDRAILTPLRTGHVMRCNPVVFNGKTFPTQAHAARVFGLSEPTVSRRLRMGVPLTVPRGFRKPKIREDVKNCSHCSALYARRIGCKDQSWATSQYCSRRCSKRALVTEASWEVAEWISMCQSLTQAAKLLGVGLSVVKRISRGMTVRHESLAMVEAGINKLGPR